MRGQLLFLVGYLLVGSGTANQALCQQPAVSRVLFGSCIKQEQPTPILSKILAADPDVFIFLGDNIYADTDDMQVMREKYAKLQAQAGFMDLMRTTRVLATWDDHDYGVNDGGAEYARRDQSQQLFVDFWEDPLDSPRRHRPGVYQAYSFGPAGQRLQVILLDTRYFRGPLTRGEQRVGGPYRADPDSESTMLGTAQWEWLEQQLRQPAEFRIIASSIQCVAQDAGQETWANLPAERRRLFQLIDDTEAEGVVIISGDRHWAELSVERRETPYPIYDLTSSSLNQPHPRGTPTDNALRADPTTYHHENFGLLSIDWQSDDPSLSMHIIDLDGQSRLSRTLKRSQLTRGQP